MTGSALYGHPPATEDDLLIVIGILRLIGLDGGKAIASAIAVIILITLITGARLALRARRRDLRWGPDDWVIIPAAIGTISWMALTIPHVTKGGIGKHLWDVTYQEYNMYQRIAALKQIIFFVTAGLIKVSIALFNRRLTGLTSQNWLYAHNIFLALVICYTVSALIVNAVQCPNAVQYDFRKFAKDGAHIKCLPQTPIQNFFIICHVVFDFTLLSVPLIVLFKMRTNTSKKIRLAFLFSIGSLSCIGSAMRLHLKPEANADRTWAYSNRLNWTIVDIFFAITAASLPVLNAAIPKRWRSPPNSDQGPEKLPVLGFGQKNGSRRLQSGRYKGRFEMNADSEDTLQEGGKSPAVTEWEDLAGSVEHPMPTHRDRAESAA